MVDMKEAPNIGNQFKTAHPPKFNKKNFVYQKYHTMAVGVLRVS